MITDVASVAPRELLFNYDELKTELDERLSEYRGLAVTPETMPDAKKARAMLNRLCDTLDDYRISVKKQIMRQYDEDFAPKVNELKTMAADASGKIAAQIKEIENAEKQEKIARLESYYWSLAGFDEARGYMAWERIQNPKWGNRTFSEDDARAEIERKLALVNGDLKAIRGMGGNVPFLLICYRENGCDFAATMRKASELRDAQEEEARRRSVEESVDAGLKQAAAAKTGMTQTGSDDTIYHMDFRVHATDAQLQMLRRFLKANGIVYGPVPERG